MTVLLAVPPFEPLTLLAIALLNPAVVLVAIIMGRKADQWQKVLVAGFAAAFAGALLIWLASFARLLPPRGAGSEAGLFVMSFLWGTLLATLAYVFWHDTRSR